jgi:hypothetical protein
MLFLSSLGFSPSFAVDLQHPKYQLQKRKSPNGQVDRREGLKPMEIAGEKLSLVSVFLNAPGLKVKRPGVTYRMGFFLKKSESRVNLKVRDYKLFSRKYHYWMLPIRKKYDGGFREFAWDAGLPRELGIRLEDLGAVALVGGYGHYVVAPVLLHAAAFPSNILVRGCRFIFVPNETMTLEYRLFPKNKESFIFLEGKSEQWPKDQKAIVSWDGRDQNRRSAPEGHYVLALNAKISYPGKPLERISYDYEFYYKPKIAYQSYRP